jgi:hypothetical protein
MTQQAVYQFGGKSFVENEWFVAKITAVGPSTGAGSCNSIPYGWIEQRVCNSGLNYQDIDINARPRFGEIALDRSPAFSIGNGTAQIGDIVLMRARGVTPNGYPVMEFVASGSSGGSGGGSVSSVQCVGNVLYVTYGY